MYFFPTMVQRGGKKWLKVSLDTTSLVSKYCILCKILNHPSLLATSFLSSGVQRIQVRNFKIQMCVIISYLIDSSHEKNVIIIYRYWLKKNEYCAPPEFILAFTTLVLLITVLMINFNGEPEMSHGTLKQPSLQN